MISSVASQPLIRLVDYQPPAWRVLEVDLQFELGSHETTVVSRLTLQPAPAQPNAPLRLDGVDLELLAIALDGAPLAAGQYEVDDTGLTINRDAIAARSHEIVLETRSRLRPDRNTRLEGLYASGPMLLTQCEAQGFRRITWFIDRPDVLARYRVELRADKATFPILLSNGNPAGSGDLEGGRHFARWVDPHPKPSYLFALVAGAIDCVRTEFVTCEGRRVDVQVWTEAADLPRCQHALGSAVRALRWDEQRFGRAYDLDVFNIVAVQHFTMGAMENKGLNIFNARYVLADAESATDADFEGVESVIGHEHFHNWSGNRVTLRDWFQLSLKEGFTVFRDQEFTSDLHSRALKRIDDVRLLKSRQFIEDAGPLAHPVRPAEYAEINNFYTATVYEKGAEVVRMLHTLLGEEAFRRGSDLYFERHDGKAATVEDFLAAMSEVSGRDLDQFSRWYSQAGTPVISIVECWDPPSGTFSARISQSTPASAGQSTKRPLHVPLRYALYDGDGNSIDAAVEADCQQRSGLLELTEAVHQVSWSGLAERPLSVYLQGLSAPVRLRTDSSMSTLARVVRVESDALTRWEAIQQLTRAALLDSTDPASARSALLDVLGELLEDLDEDPAFVAECHRVADVWTLADSGDRIDLDALLRRREDWLDEIAECHADRFDTARQRLQAAASGDRFDAAALAARRLRNLSLQRLTRLDPLAQRAQQQFAAAQCMTDRLAALSCLIHSPAPAAAEALQTFRQRWQDDPLVTDKWISLVATRDAPEALDAIRSLFDDSSVWQPGNPNRVRALLGSFVRSNPVVCHLRDGSGYALAFSRIAEVDRLNPQVSARVLTAFEPWRRLDSERRALIEGHLRALLVASPSADLRDVLQRLLATA